MTMLTITNDADLLELIEADAFHGVDLEAATQFDIDGDLLDPVDTGRVEPLTDADIIESLRTQVLDTFVGRDRAVAFDAVSALFELEFAADPDAARRRDYSFQRSVALRIEQFDPQADAASWLEQGADATGTARKRHLAALRKRAARYPGPLEDLAGLVSVMSHVGIADLL